MSDFLRISPIVQFIESANFSEPTGVESCKVEFGMTFEFSKQVLTAVTVEEIRKRLSDGIGQEYADRLSNLEIRQ